MADNPYAAFADPVDAPKGGGQNPYASFADPVGGPAPSSNNDDDEGFWTSKHGITAAIGHGLLQSGKNLADTVDALGAHGTAGDLRAFIAGNEKSAGLDNYQPHSPNFRWNDRSTWGEAPYAALENLPYVGMAMPELKGLGMPLEIAAEQFGPSLKARMANQPEGAQPSATDYGAAAADAAAQGALARVGLGRMPGKLAGNMGKSLGGGFLGGAGKLAEDLATSTAAGAGGSAASNLIDQAATTAGTAAGTNIDPEQAYNAAALGGVTGAGLRLGTAGGDVVNSLRMRDRGNGDAYADLANRFQQSGADLSTGKGVAQGHELVAKKLSRDIDESIQGLQQQSGNPDGLRGLPPAWSNSVNDIRDRLNAGQVIPDKQLSAFQNSIGPDGTQLSHLLQVQNVQNRVANFNGGIIAGPLGHASDLKNLITSHGGHNVPLNAIAAFEAADKLGVMPTVALAAAGVASRPIFKGIDAFLGLKNPTQEFVNRYGNRSFNTPGAPIPAETQGPQLTDQQKAQVAARLFQQQQQQQTNRQDAQTGENAQILRAKQGRQDAQTGENAQIALAKAQAKTQAPKAPKGRTEAGGSMGPYTGPSLGNSMPTHSEEPYGYQPKGFVSGDKQAPKPAYNGPMITPAAPMAGDNMPSHAEEPYGYQPKGFVSGDKKAPKPAPKPAYNGPMITPAAPMAGDNMPSHAEPSAHPARGYASPEALIKKAPKIAEGGGGMAPFTGTPMGNNMPGLDMGGPPSFQPAGYASPVTIAKAKAKAGAKAPSKPEEAPTATSATQAQANGTGAQKAAEAQQSATGNGNPIARVKARLKLQDISPVSPASKDEIDKIFAQADEMGQRGNYATQPPLPNGKIPGSGIAAEAIRKAYGKPAADHEAPKFHVSNGEINVTHRELNVTRPFVNSMGEPVKHEDRYISEIVNHLGQRANMRDELRTIMPAQSVDPFMARLNDRSMTGEVAQQEMAEYIHKAPKAKQAEVMRIINKHVKNVLSTFDY
jgi:hypothetical protein